MSHPKKRYPIDYSVTIYLARMHCSHSNVYRFSLLLSEVARRYGVSVTALLCCIMAESIMEDGTRAGVSRSKSRCLWTCGAGFPAIPESAGRPVFTASSGSRSQKKPCLPR